jgi:hypothetical protein
VLADELGFEEAWISEHGTFLIWEKPDSMPCVDLVICKATALTKKSVWDRESGLYPSSIPCRSRLMLLSATI